jgi:hypothetical protein
VTPYFSCKWVLKSSAGFELGSANLAELATLLPPKAFAKAVKGVKDKQVKKLAALADAL